MCKFINTYSGRCLSNFYVSYLCIICCINYTDCIIFTISNKDLLCKFINTYSERSLSNFYIISYLGIIYSINY